jgi:monoterpene epsilon-lactone hydrolase
MIAANERFYQMKVMDLEKIGGVLTDKEISMILRAYRYSTTKRGKDEWKKYEAPAGLRIEQIDAGGVPAEWQIVPGAAEDKVLLYYHGGGFCLLSPATHRPLTVEIAKQTKMKVLSVDYRMLPEHTAQNLMDDCLNAYKWLLARGIKPGNIIVGGDSAGGSITLMLLELLRNAGLPYPGGAVCISPSAAHDITEEGNMKNFTTDPTLGTNGVYILFMNLFKNLPKSFIENLAPLNASMKGWPPLLFQTTTCEILHDHSKRMVEKAKAAGVPAELQSWDGMIHVFQLFGFNYFPEAKEAIAKIAAFVNEHVRK